MALSDLVVRKAKATGKDYSLPDFDGLGLFVSATGSKAWHFRYYWGDNVPDAAPSRMAEGWLEVFMDTLGKRNRCLKTRQYHSKS